MIELAVLMLLTLLAVSTANQINYMCFKSHIFIANSLINQYLCEWRLIYQEVTGYGYLSYAEQGFERKTCRFWDSGQTQPCPKKLKKQGLCRSWHFIDSSILESECNSRWLNSYSFYTSLLLLLPFYHVLRYLKSSSTSVGAHFHLPIKGYQLRMQSRPAFHRFRGPAWNRGGVRQPLPNLCRHPSHWLHLYSLGGWIGVRHLHTIQWTLC